MITLQGSDLKVKKSANGLEAGDKRNELTVLGASFRLSGRWHFVCRCNCGKVVTIQSEYKEASCRGIDERFGS